MPRFKTVACFSNLLMKFFVFITLVLSFCSCSDKTSKKQNETAKLKDSLGIKSDSFNVQDLDNQPSLQTDILLDTIYISRTKRHNGITIIIPKLPENDYRELVKLLRHVIENKKKEFYKVTSEDIVSYDSSRDDYTGCDLRIEPKNLYRTERLISFVIEVDQGCGGPIGFNYSVINFDNKKKKQISLGDYFVLKTSSDTTYLEKIIGRAINRDFRISDYLRFNESVNFSFDSSHVYFCFDRYNMYYWGISSVKKEYILEHIHPEYR
jgi:hypothetical protein